MDHTIAHLQHLQLQEQGEEGFWLQYEWTCNECGAPNQYVRERVTIYKEGMDLRLRTQFLDHPINEIGNLLAIIRKRQCMSLWPNALYILEDKIGLDEFLDPLIRGKVKR